MSLDAPQSEASRLLSAPAEGTAAGAAHAAAGLTIDGTATDESAAGAVPGRSRADEITNERTKRRNTSP